MATNNNDDGDSGEAAADQMTREQIDALATALIENVKCQYDTWVAATPGLESPQAQLVVFASAVDRLAQAGIGLGALIQQVGRGYGIVFKGMEINDEQGQPLVRQRPEPMPYLVPGSSRKDN